jgi:hypothetical protein
MIPQLLKIWDQSSATVVFKHYVSPLTMLVLNGASWLSLCEPSLPKWSYHVGTSDAYMLSGLRVTLIRHCAAAKPPPPRQTSASILAGKASSMCVVNAQVFTMRAKGIDALAD